MQHLTVLLCAAAATLSVNAQPTPAPFAQPQAEPSAHCQVRSPELQHGHYVGDCRDGLAHGHGRVQPPDHPQPIYSGEFADGLRAGQGHMRYPNGDRYNGQWHNDQRHGLGDYDFGDRSPWAGDRYHGHWVANRFHGRGRYDWVTGDHYDGTWDNGQQTGPATSAQLRRQVHGSALLETLPRTGYQVCPIVTGPRLPMQSARVTSVVEDRLLLQVTGSDAPSWQPAASWRPCPPQLPLD